MHIKVIARLGKIVWTRYERYRAELMFYEGPKQVFWMSKKQGDKLKGCTTGMRTNKPSPTGKVFGIFDGDRYVWCGAIEYEKEPEDFEQYSGQPELRNDLPWAKKHFKVKDEDVDLSTSSRPPYLEVPDIVEVDKELLDAA